jgi:hypothetical protein
MCESADVSRGYEDIPDVVRGAALAAEDEMREITWSFYVTYLL